MAAKTKKWKRKTGIPTGNAGEYFVMGELLRQGYDAQLADRNTKGYDMLVGSGRPDETTLRKVQVKTARSQTWWVNRADFKGERLKRGTVYVLLGPEHSNKPVRFFIAKNSDLKKHFKKPRQWKHHGFMSMKVVAPYEDEWKTLLR
jgi:hypothetical protein